MSSSPPALPATDSLWMPFTSNRQFKAAPRLLVSARGMYYSREEIASAIARQSRELDFAPTFQMGHPLAFEAATRLARIMPAGLDRIFFTNSGSEAVDTALKIALAYHRARGEPQRFRFIGRERGYHGVGFGGISVGGIAANRRAFAANLMPGVDHLPHTYQLSEAAFSRGQPLWGAHLADELERLLTLHDPSTIAGVIVEPLAGSTGVLVPPRGYLERLHALCARHGLLLIFDEVITAFGRLGAATASEYFGLTPDLMTLAKGINNASVPMGAVAVRRSIHDTVIDAASQDAIELFHGYTYSAHPVAMAAAIATLELYEHEQLFARARSLAPRPAAPGSRAYEVFLRCLERGVLVRYTGDTLAVSPPLIVEPAQIEQIFGTVAEALQGLA